jgi:hypothetical protein
MRRTLKLRPDTPDGVVRQLVIKHHYVVQSRVSGVGITLTKITPTSDAKYTAERTGTLSPVEEYELERRCDRIVEWFADPYGHTKEVRRRLHNLRQHLKLTAEQQFVLEYMDENFPEEG